MVENISTLMKIVFAAKMRNQIEDAKNFLDIASRYTLELHELDQIAYLQNEIKDYKSSVETLKKCIAISDNPNEKYAIRANLAKVLNHMNDPYQSIGYSKVNASVNKDDFDSQLEIAFSHYLMGDYKNSETIMRSIVNQENVPDQVMNRVLYNLGSYDIERGDFKKGLKGFIDVGHKIGIWNNQEIENVPVWDGSIQLGKTLLIHAEGGLGDEIINIRFLKQIEKLGMNPIWLSNSTDIASVFRNNGFNAITKQDDNLKIDLQCMAMYLPILLDLDYNEVWSGSYLNPDQNYIDKWKYILPEGKKLAVKWTGNPAYEQDLHRSLPLEFIKDLKFDGIKINLQLEEQYEQENMFNAGKYITCINDTLAILTLCDTFVTSCTSVAHMAGAIGKGGVVCPPIASYYVWLGNSKWYNDNLKVFRQTNHKNWKTPFDDTQGYLNASKF